METNKTPNQIYFTDTTCHIRETIQDIHSLCYCIENELNALKVENGRDISTLYDVDYNLFYAMKHVNSAMQRIYINNHYSVAPSQPCKMEV